MQGMDGLKTAMRIKEKYPKLLVVLVTAYMNYALDGYKVKASRFLLKDNLADTIEECMDDLIAEINKNRRILEFRFVEGTIKLYADDIIYIETELHKNVFYTEKGTFQIYKKLDELENEFNDMGFVRAHLSFLVNMRYITKISGYVMTLTTGKKIPVPKARYAQVKREYMLYKGEERIKIAVLTEQNQKNRIANYQDREEIYERQRRKMHDYKNQLSTIQTLIKNGHTDEALSFTQWSSCKEMVFVCVIWSFDDMGLGEQVILSDKGNRETEQIINIGKVIIFWNRDGRMFYVKDYRLCFFISKNIRDIRRKCNRQFSVVSVEQQFCSVPVKSCRVYA